MICSMNKSISGSTKVLLTAQAAAVIHPTAPATPPTAAKPAVIVASHSPVVLLRLPVSAAFSAASVVCLFGEPLSFGETSC